MKKTLFILLLTLLTGTTFAQCAYTYSAPNTTATFTHVWPIVGTQSVDSIRMDYGDGSASVLFAPAPFNSNHTYPGGGWYNTCLTRYISDLTQPNVVLQCNYCDSVFIPGAPAPCTTTLAPLVAGNGTISASASSTGGTGPFSYSYTLNPGNITNASGSFTGLTPGSYTVCVTGFDAMQNVCSIDCDSIVIGNNPAPCTTLVTATSIANTINATAIASFGVPPYTYSYTLNPGNITNATGVFTGLTLNMYTVCATATDAMNQTCTSGCDTLGAGISFVCTTTIALSSTGNTVNATASTTGGNPPYTYSYTLNPGNITNSTGIFPGLANGAYAVCVSSMDATQNTCSTDCDTISVNNNSTSCTTSISLNSGIGSLTATAASSGGTAPYTHLYTLNPGNINNTSGIFNGLPTGSYTVCAVGIDANADTCITACDSTFVTGNTVPCSTTISLTTSGNAVTATGSATGGVAPYTFNYTLNPGNISNTTGLFNGLANGWYQVCVIAVDAQLDSCNIACDSVFVNNNTSGGCIATAGYSANISGLTATLTNSSTCSGCAAPMTYFWEFGDGNTSTMASPTHTYASPNNYTICLTVNGFDSLQSPCSDSLCDSYMVGASAVNNFTVNALTIYPNPTNGNFTIEVPEGEKAKRIIIEDVTGRKIISRQYANSLGGKLFFDLKNNAGGIYFIKLQTDRQLYTSTILNQE